MSALNRGIRYRQRKYDKYFVISRKQIECKFDHQSHANRWAIALQRWQVPDQRALEVLPGWWSGVVVSELASINEVNQRLARLVLRWVTVFGFNSRWGTFISVWNQPPRSTQPGHPFVGRRNEYQPKGGDALRLGSKGRYGSCVGGR